MNPWPRQGQEAATVLLSSLRPSQRTGHQRAISNTGTTCRSSQRPHLSSWNSPGADEPGSPALPPEQRSHLPPTTAGDPPGLQGAENQPSADRCPVILPTFSWGTGALENTAPGLNTRRRTAWKIPPGSRNTASYSISHRKPPGCGAGSAIARRSESEIQYLAAGL